MRKRNMSFLLDHLFWYIIYALPFLAFLVALRAGSANTFNEFMTANSFFTDNFVYTTFKDLFGSTGIVVLFDDTVLSVFSWFCNCVIVHLAVDFLLFIPRLAHKWLGEFTSGGSDCD